MTNRRTPVRVLIVDDSAVMRQLLSSLLEADPEISVVGTAADPYIARERIKALAPDVVTLDVEMPHMDGLTFLRKILALRPMPVVMISTLTQGGAETTLEALEIGAVDFVAKPAQERADWLLDLAEELQQKVKAAAQVRVTSISRRVRITSRSSAPATDTCVGCRMGHRSAAIGHGRCLVPFGGACVRQVGSRRHPDRDGQRRRRRPFGIASGGRIDARPR
jgi:two-component system, chemotaxis family, protein-glutamate methylesterase/glutaminase